MIRAATVDDMADLLAAGAEFHARAAMVPPLDLSTLEATMAGIMANPGAVILTDGAGSFAGAMCVPSWMNGAVTVGQELFWWAKPGAGLGLLDALEAWAVGLGCQLFVMVALESLRPEAVGALYRRRGYRSIEHGYMKDFG